MKKNKKPLESNHLLTDKQWIELGKLQSKYMKSQRIGQAYMNALLVVHPHLYYKHIVGDDKLDCFDDDDKVLNLIRYLNKTNEDDE